MNTTTQAKHTPGPWTVSTDRSGMIIRNIPPSGFPPIRVADIAPSTYAHEKERNAMFANAQLIASAPALLEALQAALTKLDHALGTDCECDNTTKANKTTCIQCMARAAIQAATNP